jgi:hypothetical protein
MNDEKPSEYNGERDMKRFWEVNRLKTEPAKQKWYLPILIFFILLSVPWYRTSGEIGRMIGGLPGWVWTSLLCTVGISILTAVGVLFFWKDEGGDE